MNDVQELLDKCKAAGIKEAAIRPGVLPAGIDKKREFLMKLLIDVYM